ncbi:MAG: radical SAM protein [Myxococcales bacterium]|nr:MAG: radical SAM protein [Myxococcales bacterium]
MIRPVLNPPNPWHSTLVDWEGEAPHVKLQVFEEEAKSILSRHESPDLNFRWSINPYRGCYHGCTYCYARPYHHYLDMGAGTDFERKIIVKINAATLLRKAFDKASWQGETLVFSGVTDCYQPLEAAYGITRQCLELCLKYKNPVGIITKGANVICRDMDLLRQLAKVSGLSVFFSIPFSDNETGRIFEPFASPIERRFAVLAELSQAGIETGVSLAPIIPGVNDNMIPTILEQASDAGAKHAFMTLLRLPASVEPYFFASLKQSMPMRQSKVQNALMSLRKGKTSSAAFHERMQGSGKRWSMIEQLFKNHCARLGINKNEVGIAHKRDSFERPFEQLNLIAT